MKTPLLFAFVILTATATAQNVQRSGGSTSTSQSRAATATRSTPSQGATTAGSVLSQPSTVESRTSVGTGVTSPTASPTTTPGATAAPGAAGTVTEPTPGTVTEPAPTSGAFVPGSLTTESRDVAEPSGATVTTPQAQAAGQAAGQATSTAQRANRDAQLQTFSDQVSSAVQLGGSSRVFFPEANSVITMDSGNGVVTLRGRVTTEQQRQQIQSSFSALPNVAQVNNEIEVATPDQTLDSQTGQRIPLQQAQPVPGTVPSGVDGTP